LICELVFKDLRFAVRFHSRFKICIKDANLQIAHLGSEAEIRYEICPSPGRAHSTHIHTILHIAPVSS